jgi:glycosyltransferase involved in cell wall biosynthesis
MSERPVFSISTSFYKRGDWVDFVYESIKTQTYPFWEWVVTDDFSEENSAEERLKEIVAQDPRVKYYKQSRKKELFYNPNYGCSGNIVMQTDSDDLIYPNLLEIYAKYFEEDPELMGITCGHILKSNLDTFVAVSATPLKERQNLDFAQMARAWRNVIPFFDLNGELNWYQNDTNIWRQVEARGKVLFLPRELYAYNYNEIDGISKVKYSWENNQSIEKERIRIESRFPVLNEQEKCTFDLKYIAIDSLTWAFYGAQFNSSTTRKDVLFIKSDIKTFEKQLLNELFHDHSLHYNVGKRDKYDEIICYLNKETYDWVKDNIEMMREKFSGTSFRFYYTDVEFKPTNEELFIFGDWSFWATGGILYGHLIL